MLVTYLFRTHQPQPSEQKCCCRKKWTEQLYNESRRKDVCNLRKGATIFYGPEESARDVSPAASITANDFYRIALRILGIYALLLTVPSVAQSVVFAITTIRDAEPFTYHKIVPLVEATIYLVSAFFLIYGAKQIAHWLSKLRYDPERRR